MPVDIFRRGPVILELFTSQGCSSCPPADALLAKLATPARSAAAASRRWRSTSTTGTTSAGPIRTRMPAWTERQHQYATALGDDRVYTPELVVGGAPGMVGSNVARHRRDRDRADAPPCSPRRRRGRTATARGHGDRARRCRRPRRGVGGRHAHQGHARRERRRRRSCNHERRAPPRARRGRRQDRAPLEIALDAAGRTRRRRVRAAVRQEDRRFRFGPTDIATLARHIPGLAHDCAPLPWLLELLTRRSQLRRVSGEHASTSDSIRSGGTRLIQRSTMKPRRCRAHPERHWPACFPNSAKHRTYAKLGEGAALASRHRDPLRRRHRCRLRRVARASARTPTAAGSNASIVTHGRSRPHPRGPLGGFIVDGLDVTRRRQGRAAQAGSDHHDGR